MFLIKETLALFIFNYTEIINATQNDIISSAVDKCWAPEVSRPSIEVFPAHNDEGIIITDIPVTEVPSITILDTPAMVETPNNIIVFPEQRVYIPIIIDFLAEKQGEKGNVIFIDGVSNTGDEILKKGKNVLGEFNIDDAYVKPKHLSTSGGKARKFLGDSKIAAEEILKDALTNGKIISITDNGVTKIGKNSYEIIIDARKIVGTRGETSIKIILSEDGGMLSAYPVN